MTKPAEKVSDKAGAGARKGDRVVATNRRATHDYHIDERIEAGLVLTGTEVKSLRDGRAQLADAYASGEGNEFYLYNLHISPYEAGNRFNHDPTRRRKLLLHRREMRRLGALVSRKGLTLVPLQIYFLRGYAKVLLGVARGKKAYDKRQAIAERDASREMRRALRERSRDRS